MRILTFIAVLCLAGAAYSGSLSRGVVTTTVPAAKSTNAVNIGFADGDTGVYGYLEKFHIRVTNAVDVDVDITMSNVYNHSTETIYSVDDLAASVTVYPRTNPRNSANYTDTNWWERIVLCGDKIGVVITDPATNYIGNSILIEADYIRVGD